MMSQPPNTNKLELTKARFSNMEFFHVGQAFRLGRYPINFHMNGNMQSSYVKECVIHESFNIAHWGGAYVLEDGIEIGNVFKNNLAVFVIESQSLLNEDVTPGNTYIY